MRIICSKAKLRRTYLIFILMSAVYICFKTTQLLSTNDSAKSTTVSSLPVSALPTAVTSSSSAATTSSSSSCSQKDNLGLSEYAETICYGDSDETCNMLTCRRLLNGLENRSSYSIIKTAMKRISRKMIPDSHFISAASDCEQFKRVQGYHLNPLSDEEKHFPIAFTILAHTNAEQFERLLRALYRPQNVYCLHVDKKSPPTFRQAVNSIAKCFENVFVAIRLESVVYAGFSRLQADINCMQDLVKTRTQWQYLINTAAQAFPIRTILEMVRILKIYNGANDIEGISGPRVIKSRFQLEWKEDLQKGLVQMTGKIKPPPPHNIEIVRGSAYGVFSRKFVQFLLTDRKAIDLLKWSNNTLTPDELYWATLHHSYYNPHFHSPGGYGGHPDEKPWMAVYAEWDENVCRGLMIHNVCVFGLEDLPRLISRKELFVNKLYTGFEPLALDCLEAWHKQNTLCPPANFDEQFYRELPFVRKNKI